MHAKHATKTCFAQILHYIQPLHYLHWKDLSKDQKECNCIPNHLTLNLITNYLQVYCLGMFHIIYDICINPSLV